MGPQLYRCGDLSRIGHICRRRNYASMGPQLYRCGDTPDATAASGSAPCFNGAATLSLRRRDTYRKMGFRVTLLQWGRNFIVAETRPCSKMSACVSPSFNGAATLSLRRPVMELQAQTAAIKLQWGRNFIVAETRNVRCASSGRDDILASMGPQLYRCGDVLPHMGGKCRPGVRCFNGAATLSLRRRRQNAYETHLMQTRASMGPQLYRCGDAYPRSWNQELPTGIYGASMGPQLYRCGDAQMAHYRGLQAIHLWLQWGRNFIVAETPKNGIRSTRSLTGRASMGPQLYRCGDGHSPGFWSLSWRPSLLQWGRNFIVAETCIDASFGR